MRVCVMSYADVMARCSTRKMEFREHTLWIREHYPSNSLGSRIWDAVCMHACCSSLEYPRLLLLLSLHFTLTLFFHFLFFENIVYTLIFPSFFEKFAPSYRSLMGTVELIDFLSFNMGLFNTMQAYVMCRYLEDQQRFPAEFFAGKRVVEVVAGTVSWMRRYEYTC